MNFRWQPLLWILAGALLTGIIYLIAQPPRGEPISLHPPPTPKPIMVHVVGAVRQPGLYTLPLDSRVQNAIEAAGGFTNSANPHDLNLAAKLQDGEQLIIPWMAATPDFSDYANHATEPAQSSFPQRTMPTLPIAAELININTASQEELETLPGIGPVTAQKIIAFRETYGPFASIESIQEVNGIGPVKFAGIKDMITVDGSQ